MDEQIKILNETFRANEEIELIEEFRFEIGYFYGCIQLSAVPKESLIFDIKVPHSYPLLDFGMKSIKFICKNAKGFLHMNEDNSICLITPQSYDFKERLSFEIHELKLWRDKYYIREERDDKYDYLIIPNQNQMTFLFTDIASQFIKNDFGMFEAVKFNQNNNVTNYYITKIGKDQCELSNSILKEEVILNGLYYFIEDEPINYGNICFNNWQQFNKIFSQKFKTKLFNLKNNKSNSLLYILIGYKIPPNNETHWQMVEVETNKIPVKGQKKALNYYEYEFIDSKISWTKTQNISSSRYFGRGSVTKELMNSNILIIGCGAIGSSLAKILVRCGCKIIALSDFDIIEPGNICRSEYFLVQSGDFKANALQTQLKMISPFLETEYSYIFKNMTSNGKNHNRELINKYDYIFDCSSDNELCFYMDSLNIDSTIINISISNKANELVCVIGRSAIWNSIKEIFSNLTRTEENIFYEGTGCWNPTFEASYFDINGLLNLAIQNINHRLKNKKNLNTFIIRNVEKNGYLNLETIDY